MSPQLATFFFIVLSIVYGGKDDETEYGTLPPTTTGGAGAGAAAASGGAKSVRSESHQQEPRPIVHMNQKQKDVFIKKMKKAGPALKKKLIKFLNRQREDDIAELKEKLGPDAEWPTKKPKNTPPMQQQQ
jgi:hypothetical protein